MARRKKAGAGADTSGISEANPTVGRLVEDAELRATLREAVQSAERAYTRLTSKRRGEPRIAVDKKLKAELQSAVKQLKRVSGKFGEPAAKAKRKRVRPVRKVVLLLTGSAAVVVSCPWMRGKVLDALFGAEEEFEYSPPPVPEPSAAPVPAPSVPPAPEPSASQESVSSASQEPEAGAPQEPEAGAPQEPDAGEPAEPQANASDAEATPATDAYAPDSPDSGS
jgi:hypothetical protein